MLTTAKEARPLFDPERLSAGMDAIGLEAIVAHSRRNFYYLSGFNSLDYVIDAESANYVIVPRDPAKPAAVTIPSSERLHLAAVPSWVPEKIYCGQFYIKNGPPLEGEIAPTTWEGLLAGLRRHGLTDGRVGFELEQLPLRSYRQLVETFPNMEIVDASPLLRELRVYKTAEEVRRIRMACEITEQAIDQAAAELQLPMTEKELADRIAVNIVARGAEALYVQVATAGAAGLGLPTDRSITEGTILRIDAAATFDGYNSDLGRGFAVGRATAEQKELYRVAYQALQAGIAAVKPGVSAADIFSASMAVWADAGFPEVQRHHVGHGIGLQAHEGPMLKPNNSTPIAADMVLAIEVPCYVYNVGGFAPEDILLVGSEGNNQFTHAPAELPVID